MHRYFFLYMMYDVHVEAEDSHTVMQGASPATVLSHFSRKKNLVNFVDHSIGCVHIHWIQYVCTVDEVLDFG